MKRLMLFVLILTLVGFGLWAEGEQLFKIAGLTDAYIIAGADGGTLTAGQDVNIDVGPVYADLTADWTKALWSGDNTLDLGYTLGYSQSFGIFTPKVELTGDQSFPLVKDADPSGDWFSDLCPSLNVTLGKVGADAYADLSFEEGYDLLQTVDVSGYANLGPAVFRAGFLYMTQQAVDDDVGYPNAPAALEGASFYAKASVSY